MEEKNVETKKAETKKKGIKPITLLILAAIFVLLLGMQAFATVNGYGNIFFMLKTIVTGEAHGENEIFYDKEITLSNKSFEVSDGVRMQINKLQIKEDESILCLTVKASEDTVLPLTYSIKGEGLAQTDIDSSKIKQIGEFEENLIVKYKFSDDQLMTLYIKDKDGNLLKEVEINLYTREIVVISDSEVNKISQIELKKYLDVFSELNNEFGIENDRLVYTAIHLDQKICYLSDVPSVEEINKIIKEYYGDKANFASAKNISGENIEIIDLKDSRALEYKKDANAYINLTDDVDYRNGICLKISDIDYKDGVYTVKYIYTLATENDIDSENLEKLAQYETTIKLIRNDDAQYSKYQIVELEKGKEVSAKVEVDLTDNAVSEQNTIINNNFTNTVSNNSSTNTVNNNSANNTTIAEEQLDYDLDKHEHIYTVVMNSGTKGPDGSHTTLNGTHIEKCSICGEERRVPHHFGKWFTIDSIGNSKAYTLWCSECKDYIYTTDYNFVKSSGYGMQDTNNDVKKKDTSVTIINSEFKVGENYIASYVNPEGEYRTDRPTCKEAGKIIITMTGGNGKYTIGIITRATETGAINLDKKVCYITNGKVEKSEFTDIKATAENGQLKAGQEYDVCYVDSNKNYKTNKAVCNENGKIIFSATGTSGKYVVTMLVDKNNNSIQTNGFSFEVDDFGNAK